MTRKQRVALALLLFAALLLLFTWGYTSSQFFKGSSSNTFAPQESLRLIVEPSGIPASGVVP